MIHEVGSDKLDTLKKDDEGYTKMSIDATHYITQHVVNWWNCLQCMLSSEHMFAFLPLSPYRLLNFVNTATWINLSKTFFNDISYQI